MKNEIKVWGQIYETKDYSMFKNINGNRKLNKSNYAKLIKSFKKQQLIIPILVNNEFEIIDGQHRRAVCEELNLPIYYYIEGSYGKEQLAMAQVSADWTNKDYLNAYVSEDDDNYLWFNDIIEKFGLGINDLQKIICNIINIGKAGFTYNFNNGEMKIANDVRIKVEEFIECLEDFSFFKEYKSGSFVSAFIKLYFYKGYEHSHMKMKLKNRQSVLTKQVGRDAYLTLITEQIYSFKSSKRIFYNTIKKEFYSV